MCCSWRCVAMPRHRLSIRKVFDQVAQFVEVFVVRSLVFSVFLWRDDGVHAYTSCLLKNGIGIIALVRNQMIRVDPLDQSAGLCAIRSGTFCRDLTGIPHASTARCILVLSPLLCGSCPDCRLWLLPHEDEPCNDWRRSSAIRNPARQSGFQATVSKSPCPASG